MMHTVLSIAGSDSCAGAGIQADIRTCMALGVFCYSIVTAVTAQNPVGVKYVRYVGDDMLRAQLDAVFEVTRPDAVKIGMLPNAAAASIVAEYIESYRPDYVVVDPVMSATSGGSLSGDSVFKQKQLIETLKDRLFPLTTLLTPNLPELQKLCSYADSDLISAARTLVNNCGLDSLLIKGGHADSDTCIDIFIRHNQDSHMVFESERIPTTHTHGTGCTLSSAIASMLACGHSLEESVSRAKKFTFDCIMRADKSPLFQSNSPLLQF